MAKPISILMENWSCHIPHAVVGVSTHHLALAMQSLISDGKSIALFDGIFLTYFPSLFPLLQHFTIHPMMAKPTSVLMVISVHCPTFQTVKKWRWVAVGGGIRVFSALFSFSAPFFSYKTMIANALSHKTEGKNSDKKACPSKTVIVTPWTLVHLKNKKTSPFSIAPSCNPENRREIMAQALGSPVYFKNSLSKNIHGRNKPLRIPNINTKTLPC